MGHKINVYKDSLEDLKIQEKMNIKFIKSMPELDEEIFKELGADIVVSGVLGETGGIGRIGDEPKLKKEEGVLFA